MPAPRIRSLYGVDDAQDTLLIFLEHSERELEGVSLELLTRGREIADETGWRLEGLLLGEDPDELAERALEFGVDKIWVIQDALLANFRPETFTHACVQCLLALKPSVFLCGATPNGRDLAGRLAVRLRTGLNADCTALRVDQSSGSLIAEVTGFGGGVIALLEMPDHRPQMATVRPGVFVAQPAGRKVEAEIEHFHVELNESDLQTRVLERVVGQGVDLTQAPVLVCGGRGIEGDFESLQVLAGLLDGMVGATRPPVDEGHIGRERQVGQTGVICRPKLSLNFGISGAFHFVVGVQDADVVIAVNTDPEAPIFEYADYCIVADAGEIVSALQSALRAEREVTRV
jgi:electron transfer flavoprotein alpha subunit